MVGNARKRLHQVLRRGILAQMMIVSVLAIDFNIHILDALLLLLTFINLSNSYNAAQVRV